MKFRLKLFAALRDYLPAGSTSSETEKDRNSTALLNLPLGSAVLHHCQCLHVAVCCRLLPVVRELEPTYLDVPLRCSLRYDI